MSYKHGIYGTAAVANGNTEVSQGTVPVYIGSAPIHRINTNGGSDFNYTNYINTPFLVSSLRQAKEMGLYSDDWDTYTLCEAIHAHFMNGGQSVAPILLLNVLNPASDVSESAGTATVTMKKVGTKFVGYIEDALCCIENIALNIDESAGVNNVKTTYAYDGDNVVIESEVTFKSTPVTSFTATATYSKIAFTAEKFTSAVLSEALNGLDYCEQVCGLIPNVIAAPVISEKPELHSLIVQKVMEKLSGKWNAVCLSDIPSTAKTYQEALTWKSTNAYDSKYDKVYWPSVAAGDKVYHLSVIGAYMMQSIDTQNGNIPYVSTSNKPLFCDRAVVDGGNTLLISEQKANDLNQAGITTVNIIKNGLRLWGAHMSNYDHSKIATIAVEDRFDTSVRMMGFILNYLQYQYINEIDQSFTRKDVDSVVNGVQTWFDSLVNDGVLLAASISFNNESNSDEDIANGDFVYDIQVTYSAIAKSITFKLQYTSAGLVTLTTSTGGEE